MQELVLAVTVNGAPMPAAIMLNEPSVGILVRQADLSRWRFASTDAPTTSVMHEGQPWLPLRLMTGLRYRIDAATQTIHIERGAEHFLPTAIQAQRATFIVPPPAPVGGFVNYDVTATSDGGRNSAGGLLEAVAFGPIGSFDTSVLARSTSSTTSGNSAGHGVVRLGSTWTRDQPAELATWRVGDAISRAGSWSQPVRLGGVQYASNFATQPGFSTLPLPGMSGVAALPSTVDLYVNGALRQRSEVPAGPFGITDVPVVTGQGETRVVVRDLLGREQVTSQPFYASAQVLRQGLRDFSYELGALRAGFGSASADYGSMVAIGTERRGLTNSLTGEFHTEIARERQALGVGAAWLWPWAGVLSASMAHSHGVAKDGTSRTIGFQRQTRGLSVGSSIVAASSGFSALGTYASVRRSVQSYGSYPVGRGSVNVNYLQQIYPDRRRVELAGAGFGVALGSLGQLSFTLLRDVIGRQTSASLSWSTPLDADRNLSASVNAYGGNSQAQVQLQRNLPAGDGVGYRLTANEGESHRAEGAVQMQSSAGLYSVDAAVTERGSAVRATAAGGLATLGGKVYASRRITDSFAVVDVPGFKGVRVYAANQLVGRTSGDGSALVPRLLPYQRNAIRIEQADLPFDAKVDALEETAVPFYRSGVLKPFPVRRSRGALLTVLLDDGEPIPVGATARLVGGTSEFTAARRGEIYVTGLGQQNVFAVEWRGQRCEFDVAVPDGGDPLPEVAAVCRGVTR